MKSHRGALAALGISMLLPSLGTSIANVALPTLATSFGVTSQRVQWVVLAYLVSMTLMLVVAGRMGDVFGARRMLLVGVVVFGFASLACAIAPTFGLLVIARALQGAGAAVMITVTLALVRSVVTTAETPRVMGMLGSVSAVGTALGPSTGGLLIATYGWRAVFILQVALAATALLVVRRHVARDVVSARAVGFSTQLLRNPTLVTGFIASALVATVLMATLVVGPFYLTRTLGLGTAAIGLVMSVGPAAAALSAAPAGRVVARYGTPRVTAAALSGLLLGSLLFAFLPRASGAAGYVASLVVLTTAYAAFQTANNTSVMLAAGDAERGVISGMLNLSRNVGLIAGASLMATIYGAVASSAAVGLQEGAAMGFHATFGAAAVLILIALGATVRKV